MNIEQLRRIDEAADMLANGIRVNILHAQQHWYTVIYIGCEDMTGVGSRYLRLYHHREPLGRILDNPEQIKTLISQASAYGLHRCGPDDWQECPQALYLDALLTDREEMEARVASLHHGLTTASNRCIQTSIDPATDKEVLYLTKRITQLDLKLGRQEPATAPTNIYDLEDIPF